MNLKPLCQFVLGFVSLIFTSAIFADDFEAVLHWQRTVPISTPVSGVVVKVDAQVGKRVEKGHILFKLDDRFRLKKVEALKAELKRARNHRNETRREMDRTQELYDRTLISDHELDLAKIQRDEGESQFKNAKASLIQAEMDLEYSNVSAPFTSWILKRNVEVGQTIVSELQAEPLIVLADANTMVARTQLSNSSLSTMKIGQDAKVIINKETFQGKISQIGLSPVQGTKDQYTVDVSFNIGGNVYRVGQEAKVRF